MSAPKLVHRTDINAESYDLIGVTVDVRLTRLPDGSWQVEEIVVPDTDDEVGVHIDELVSGAVADA